MGDEMTTVNNFPQQSSPTTWIFAKDDARVALRVSVVAGGRAALDILELDGPDTRLGVFATFARAERVQSAEAVKLRALRYRDA